MKVRMKDGERRETGEEGRCEQRIMKLPKKLTTMCANKDSTLHLHFSSRSSDIQGIDIKGLQNQIISPRYHLDTASHQGVD
ncbi:hypothetical protein L1987_63738 [Smallanthus sonchifolius]|uniref:Uncharacterized protein n=1 Tax=Smallanthus sonchifolius TaxID=185202 RepID=A0ACB9CE09_9ASTR|nr:hypothetical protein L1987_63738 [Smallanthus sonchifolius]